MRMQVRLWGVRGSIATPMTTALLQEKARALLSEATPADLASPEAIARLVERSPHARTYGGNSSCVEVSCGDQVLILDAGTGIRNLGLRMAADGRAKTHRIDMLFTHFHWDHICGFPFFGPIYAPDREIGIWSGRSDARRLLAAQMGDAHFPAKWDNLPSRITCTQIPEGDDVSIGQARVRILPMVHPDKAYGYRVTVGGRSVCYLTDTEVTRNPDRMQEAYARFVSGADVVIVDAMYGFLDSHERVNWGHSSIFNFIDFFRETEIGELVIFHHDPMASDFAVAKLAADAVRYRDLAAPGARWRLTAASEGQSWDLPPRS
jgi:phosphoribosyl 1,2-cyclic phosphodiesterase